MSGGRRVLVVAGEPSGERHAAGLVEAARARDPSLRFAGVGGPRLAAASCEILHDASRISVVGITEVVGRLPALREVMRDLARRLAEERYDAVLLVDFPDFNLRVARAARAAGVPVVYFVSPQVWAWRRGRVRTIRARVDRMIVLFRFEERFYRAHGVPVTFAGHPLAEVRGRAMPAGEARVRLGWPADAPVYGLLPGSRPGEIARHLPPMLAAARLLLARQPRARFVLPVADGLDRRLIDRPLAEAALPVRAEHGAFDLLAAACDAALAASGTATLELAVRDVPAVVVYRTSWLTHAIARLFVRVPHVALVNLVAGREVEPELLQSRFTPERAADALLDLARPERRERVLAALAEVRRALGPPGAYRRAAGALLEVLDGNPARRGESAR